ncbi:MAG: GTP pyrophosphokinase family protein [Bacilli bacterium]
MNEKIEKIDWSTFLQPYEFAVKNFILKFEFIKQQYIDNKQENPIEDISGRVKTPHSILEKLNRLNVSVNRIRELNDIGGIRITCKYVEEVYEIYELLKSRKDIQIKVVKDYIKYPKESGYRSLHVIAIYEAETINGQLPILIEFQIRTLSMHLWATIEHTLKYKYAHNIPEDIRKSLIAASKITNNLDLEMERMKQEMSKFQKEEINDDTANYWKDWKIFNSH